MPASSSVRTSLTELTVPRSWAWVVIEKSALAVALMPWRLIEQGRDLARDGADVVLARGA